LTLRKITKIVATRCQILWLKCTKFDFGWGSAPDPAGGVYSAPPDTLAGLGEGRGWEGRGEGTGRGRGGDETPPLHARPNRYFWIRPWSNTHPGK